MSRSLHANIIATLDDAFIRPVMFVELRFDDGTIYFHNDLGSITWGGHTWTGVGDVGSISPLEETDGAVPGAIEVSLSGINNALLTEARTQTYQDRPVVIYFGARDAITAGLVSDPAQLFFGFMDQMIIVRGKTQATITVRCESEQVRWQRSPLKYYDDGTQQRDHAGDIFFQFLKDMANLSMRWGNDFPVDLGQPNSGGRT